VIAGKIRDNPEDRRVSGRDNPEDRRVSGRDNPENGRANIA
jgi:hypothetical protein